MVESKRRSLIFIIFIEEMLILKLLLFPDFERYKIVEFRIIRYSLLIIIFNTLIHFSNSRILEISSESILRPGRLNRVNFVQLNGKCAAI